MSSKIAVAVWECQISYAKIILTSLLGITITLCPISCQLISKMVKVESKRREEKN